MKLKLKLSLTKAYRIKEFLVVSLDMILESGLVSVLVLPDVIFLVGEPELNI